MCSYVGFAHGQWRTIARHAPLWTTIAVVPAAEPGQGWFPGTVDNLPVNNGKGGPIPLMLSSGTESATASEFLYLF